MMQGLLKFLGLGMRKEKGVLAVNLLSYSNGRFIHMKSGTEVEVLARRPGRVVVSGVASTFTDDHPDVRTDEVVKMVVSAESVRYR